MFLQRRKRPRQLASSDTISGNNYDDQEDVNNDEVNNENRTIASSNAATAAADATEESVTTTASREIVPSDLKHALVDDDGMTSIKREKKKNEEKDLNNNNNNNNNSTTRDVVYSSTKDAAPMQYAGGVTAQSETETPIERDALSLLEKKKGEGSNAFIPLTKDQIAKNKVTGMRGPIRGSAYIRNTTVFDYQKNICKDFKETGYCGFGDNCIFLHDRGDYKSGFELEKEYEREQKRKKKEEEEREKALLNGESTASGAAASASGKAKKNGLPFTCRICGRPFNQPVVTRCGHYFCSCCATNRFINMSTTCAVCGANTNGIFNDASKLFA